MANTISDKLEYLEGTKSAIKDAIVAKGVAVEDTATFRSYAEKIGEISGGGGGKVNLNDYGLTLAYSKPTNEQLNNLEFSFPTVNSTKNFFKGMVSTGAYINLFPIWNTSMAYDCNEMLAGASVNQIDFPQEIVISDGNNMFNNFSASAMTLDTLVVSSPNGFDDMSFMFRYADVVCNHLIVRSVDNAYVIFNFTFASLENTITALPNVKIEAVNSRIRMECGGIYSQLPSNITTLPLWDLTGVTEGQNFTNWFDYS